MGLLLLVLLLAGSSAAIASAGTSPIREINVRDFGAAGDGKTPDTRPIQKAIDACAANGGGRIIVPAGTFLCGPLALHSHVELHLEAGAVLLGSPRLADYLDGQAPPAPVKDKTAGPRAHRGYPDNPLCLIDAEDLDDVAITGLGTINGNGGSPEFDRGDNDQFRPKILIFHNCRDVCVSGVTIRDSATWVQHYIGCTRVRISGIRVYSHTNLNNDGLDIDSDDVNVSDCVIDSDDDGICLKSDRDQPCRNIAITNCIVASNCNAIKMGTASRGGFVSVAISNCVIRAAGEHRQRTWKDGISGLALESVDGGTMDRVTVSNLTMSGIQTPIFIRLGRRRLHPSEAGGQPHVGALRNIIISNIVAKSDGPLCSSITGIPGAPAQNIKLSHLILECPGNGTIAMADRHVPENERGYPENRMFGPTLPAYGFYVRHVRNLTLEDIQLNAAHRDERSAIAFDDVANLRLRDVDLDAPRGAGPAITARDVSAAMIDFCRVNGPCKAFVRASGRNDLRLFNNAFGSAVAVEQAAPPSHD